MILTWSNERRDDYGLAEAVHMTFTLSALIAVYTVFSNRINDLIKYRNLTNDKSVFKHFFVTTRWHACIKMKALGCQRF